MVRIQGVQSLAGVAIGHQDAPKRPLRVRLSQRRIHPRPKPRDVGPLLRMGRLLSANRLREKERRSQPQNRAALSDRAIEEFQGL